MTHTKKEIDDFIDSKIKEVYDFCGQIDRKQAISAGARFLEMIVSRDVTEMLSIQKKVPWRKL